MTEIVRAETPQREPVDISLPQQSDVVSLRDVLLPLFKFKWMILSTVTVAVAGTLMYLWIVPSRYEVGAKLLIKFSRTQANPRSALSNNPTVSAEVKPDINSEAELIKSYGLLKQVVIDLKLDQPGAPAPPSEILPRIKFELRRAYGAARELLEELQIRLALKERLNAREIAIIELMKGLTVTPVKDSSVIDVTLMTRFKEGSSTILNHLLEIYRDRQLGVERNPAVADFFRKQASEFRTRLDAREEEMNQLKRSRDISSLSEQISMTLDQLMKAEQALKETASVVQEVEAKTARLEQQVESEPATILSQRVNERNEQVDWLEERKAALTLERQRLAGKYQDDHVLIRDLDRQISAVNDLLKTAQAEVQRSATTAVNATHTSLKQDLLQSRQALAAARARLDAQTKIAIGYRARLASLRDAELAFRKLARDMTLYEETYRLYQKEAEEVTAAEALNARGITSIVVLDPAEDPIVPAGMRKLYVLLAALVGSLLVGVTLAFIAEGLDHTVGTPVAVERRLGRPVIAAIDHKSHLAATTIEDGFVEAAVSIVTELDRIMGEGRTRVISVFGARPGAGATTVVRSLVEVLGSRFRLSTVVVSLENAGAEIVGHRGASARGPVDLSNGDVVEQVLERSQRGTALLPAAYFPQHLSGPGIASVLARWPDRFGAVDYVLVDVSSSVPRDQQLGVAQGSQAVILVVEAGRTTLEDLDRVRVDCQRFGINLVGAVLNKRKNYIPQFLAGRL